MNYDHLAKHKPTPFMPAPPSPTLQVRFFFWNTYIKIISESSHDDSELQYNLSMNYNHLAKHKPTPLMPAPPSPTGMFFLFWNVSW